MVAGGHPGVQCTVADAAGLIKTGLEILSQDSLRPVEGNNGIPSLLPATPVAHTAADVGANTVD